MALETIPLPEVAPGWNPLSLMPGEGEGWKRPYEFLFPTAYLPSDQFLVVNEYSNTLLLPKQYDPNILAVQLLPVGGGAAGILGVSVPLFITLRRSGNSGVVGADKFTDVTPSPRIGFSIGSYFKNQTYLRLDLTGYGWQTGYTGINWIWIECTPMLETSSNCRLKKMYVRHGKLVSVREDPIEQRRYFKVLDSTDEAPLTFHPGGQIDLYSADGKKMTFPVLTVNKSWEVVAPWKPSGGDTKPEETPIVSDMFFSFSSAWAIEDPRMMHEYGLSLQTGVYETVAQKFAFGAPATDVIGIWLPPTAEEGLYVLYVDPKNASKIPLPQNAADADRRKEAMKAGGTLAEGIQAFRARSPMPASVRIVMRDIVGSKSKQNFCAGNLTDEYIIATDRDVDQQLFGLERAYSILSQPRNDTIEVLNASVNSKSLFVAVDDAQSGYQHSLELIQQKFWMTTEVYAGDISSGAPEGLWIGEISGISIAQSSLMQVEWETFESQTQTLSLNGELTGDETLLRRYRNSDKIGTYANCKNAFVKFKDWRVRNKTKGATYRVYKMGFEDLDDTGRLKVKAYFEGAGSSDFGIGDRVYVQFGEEYSNAFGLSPEASIRWQMQTRPALGAGSQYRIWMNGYLSLGEYAVPADIPPTEKFSLVDFSYGGDFIPGNQATIFGNPYVWIGTKGRITGISFIEYCVGQRHMVYYNDKEFSAITSRSSSPAWIQQREQKLIVCGLPKIIKKSGDFTSGLNVVTGVYARMPNEEGPLISPYWLSVKDNVFAPGSSYFSCEISGRGGVKTPLAMVVNAVAQVTQKSPIYLPFEYYPVPFKRDASPDGKTEVFLPAYYRKHAGGEEDALSAGLERIVSADKLKALYNQKPVSLGSVSIPLKALEAATEKQLLSGVTVLDAVATNSGYLYLFYGMKMPVTYSIGSTDFQIAKSVEKNPSMPAVFVVRSEDSGRYWGSPKYTMDQAFHGGEELAVWSKPMLLLADFEYMQAIFNKSSNICMIFGYGYTRDLQGILRRDREHLFIGVYRFHHETFADNPVFSVKAAVLSASSIYEDKEVFSYYRRPGISFDFGRGLKVDSKVKKWPAQQTAVGNEESADTFVKIVGGASSGALIRDVSLLYEVFSLSTMSDGTIKLFMRDAGKNAVVAITSRDDGASWSVDPVSYVGGGQAPVYVFEDIGYLFFFEGESLKVKRIRDASSPVAIGQEPRVTIATGVAPQRVSAGVNRYGEIGVYYMTKGGYMTASVSQDCGDTWQTMVNW